jgi:hypothetical protein
MLTGLNHLTLAVSDLTRSIGDTARALEPPRARHCIGQHCTAQSLAFIVEIDR